MGVIMKKVLKNVAIGVMVGTIVAGGAFALKKAKLNSGRLVKEESLADLPDPTLEKIIVYNDGSMRFFFDFPEEYNLEKKDDYVEEREDEIDYVEIYNEDGTKERIDYPISESVDENKTGMLKLKVPQRKRV